MAQRALITGISGFVGGFLAEHLLDAGDEVLSTSPDGRWMDSSPPGLVSRVEVLPWDLSQTSGSADATRRCIKGFEPEVIYHLAALSIPADCGRDRATEAAVAVNVDGTARVIALADSLCDAQKVAPRLVFISSSHVYRPVTFESPRVDETAPLAPVHGYGQTKLEAERLVLTAARQGRFEAVVARAFQHTGPRQSPRMMLPQWAGQLVAFENEPSDDQIIEVHTLDALVDISDVRDVVRAYRLLAGQGRNGEIYNVGSGLARRSGDLLDLLMQIGGTRRPVVELRPGAKQDPVADISRLQSETGWRPQIPVEQTIEDTLQYWREQINSTEQ